MIKSNDISADSTGQPTNGAPRGSQDEEAPESDADLSPMQEAAIPALVGSPTYVAAAESSGVGISTIRRWIRSDPMFRRRLREAREAVFDSAVRLLHSASPEAAGVLNDIAKNPEASQTARVSAARALLQFSCRGRKMSQLEERMAELEERIETVIAFLESGPTGWKDQENS